MSETRSLLPELMHIAQRLPLLRYDIDNASTLFTQQKCIQEIHTFLSYIVQHQINEGYAAARKGGLPAVAVAPGAAPAPRAAQPVARPMPAPPIAGSPLPGIPPLHAPSASMVAPAQPTGGKVVDVTITPQGTSVSAPGLPQMRFAPGDPIPPIDELVAPENVAIPAGGIMTPETAAALAAAGGARNITSEPVIE